MMTFRSFSILPLLLLIFFLKSTAGNLTLLITGNFSGNVHEYDLASLFVTSYAELTRGLTSEMFVFSNSLTLPEANQNTSLVSKWGDLELLNNVTTLIVTRVGIDELNDDLVHIMHKLMMVDNPIVVIEIGNSNVKIQELLQRIALCHMRSCASKFSPNVVHFCNNASPEMLSNLSFANIYGVEALTPLVMQEKEQSHLIWPNFFASAAKVGERTQKESIHDYHHHHHKKSRNNHHNVSRHFDEDVEEIVDMIMENMAGQNGASSKQVSPRKLSKADKKLMCKYRKSCYETGVKPKVKSYYANPLYYWWKEKIQESGNNSKKDEKELLDSNEVLPIRKLQCKYRHSCYKEHGIPFQEKSDDREHLNSLHLGKSRIVQHGKKRTLKEIAAETLKKLEETKEKFFRRPLVKTVDTQLNAVGEKLSEKLNCKYRKSCYETGELPYIAEAWSIPSPIRIFSTESVESESNRINYDQLKELEKKLYCKYRKSCYETGVKPDIEPEISINSLKDLTTIHEQIETRKQTLQEKCKYRKSCYESGVIPEINPRLEAAINREVSGVIPTSTQDLRSLCKYRKSCYAEIHNSATVDTIKLIRKRRQITREVRRRRARRAKLHRRLRGDMQLGHYQKFTSVKSQNDSVDEQNGKSMQTSQNEIVKKIRKHTLKKIYENDSHAQSVNEIGKGKKKVKQPLFSESAKYKEAVSEKKERKIKKTKREEKLLEAPIIDTGRTDSNEASMDEAKKPEKINLQTPLSEVTKDEKEEQKLIHTRTSDDGKKPLDKATQAMNRLIDEMHRQKAEQEQKEFCKYRKSCYATGKKPDIKQSFGNFIDVVKEQIEREIKEATVSKTEVQKKLDCKYRKSCYSPENYPSKDEAIDLKAKHIYPSIKSEQDAKAAQPIAMTDGIEGVVPIGLERYRRNGKCSPYYYSCREILGLPPKERAPIGPNGKRLCRKKKSL